MEENRVVPDSQINSDPPQTILPLQQNEQEMPIKRSYMRAYMLSIFLPPIGLYYFLKYVFFSPKDLGSTKAGIVSLVLTVLSLVGNIWGLQVLFTQFTSQNSQSVNFLEDLITPENMKTFRDLTQ